MQPNPEYLLEFFLTLSLLAGIAVAVVKIFGKPKKQSIEQPIAVREWKEYATKEELQELEHHMRGEFACVQTGMRDMRKEIAGDANRREEKQQDANDHLHKRISDLRDHLDAAGEKRSDKLLGELKDMRKEFKSDTQELHGRITALATKPNN